MSQVDAYGLPPGVRDEYLTGARDQLGTIAELAERLVAAGDDTEALEALRRDAHRIRGSAGSFGFPNATMVAAELEDAVRGWLKLPAEGAATRGAAVRGYVRRLAAALFTKSQAAAAVGSRTMDPPAGSELEPESNPEIILVEDDAALVDLITFGLEARGYRYRHYDNGREALADLVKMDTGGTKPVLVLDVDLPALDGYSIFETLQQERPGKFQVIFMTVHGTEIEQLRGLEGGAADYLVKPVSLRVALEKIRHLVGK